MSIIKTSRIRTLIIVLYPNILSTAAAENRNNETIIYNDKANNIALNIDLVVILELFTCDLCKLFSSNYTLLGSLMNLFYWPQAFFIPVFDLFKIFWVHIIPPQAMYQSSLQYRKSELHYARWFSQYQVSSKQKWLRLHLFHDLFVC